MRNNKLQKMKIYPPLINSCALLILTLSFLCESSLSANLTRSTQSKKKDNSIWNSPVQLAYDFSNHSELGKDYIPENDEGNEVLALLDESEMHQAAEHSQNSSQNSSQNPEKVDNEETAQFIRELLD